MMSRNVKLCLSALMGFYVMLAFNANAVELGLPHEMAEPPLPVGPTTNRGDGSSPSGSVLILRC
jgi:hypothetical protein